MALNRRDIPIAKEILWSIFPQSDRSFTDAGWGDDPIETDTVYGYDRKVDDGYENVFINVQNLTDDQKQAFEEQAKRISNSRFCREVKDNPGLIRIGWY